MNTITGGNYAGAKIKLGLNGCLKMSYKGRTAPLAPSIKKVKSLGRTNDSKGAAQSALLLGVGFAVAAAAKSIWLVEIQFKSGKKSVAEVDDGIYKALMSQTVNTSGGEDLPPAGSVSNAKIFLVAILVVVILVWLFSSIFSNDSKPEWQTKIDETMQGANTSTQLKFAKKVFLESSKKGGAYTSDQYSYLAKTYHISCKTNKKKETKCAKTEG